MDNEEKPKKHKVYQVKKRFQILDKTWRKLLPPEKKLINFLLDSVQREIIYQLQMSTERRKKQKEKAKLNS